jgi:chemotaxis protein methyltransferase CheR
VVSQEDLDRLSADFAAYTGVHLRPRDEETLRNVMAARMRSLHLRQGGEYCRLLASDDGRAEPEWRRLIAALANPETYFFRDEGQMSLLRQTLLPELIERNRRRRSLRLWSAGCSTGEEAYSLAILVSELLPDWDRWDVRIVGTDINESSLEAARRGIYGAWSFRSMDPALRDRYFNREREGYRVEDRVRAMVTFRPLNLVRDTFPDARAGIVAMDLILCRNVFIYFAPDRIEAVLAKLAATLAEHGYLMMGHAELRGQPPHSVQARRFDGAVVYQSTNDERRTTNDQRPTTHDNEFRPTTARGRRRPGPSDAPDTAAGMPALVVGRSSLVDAEPDALFTAAEQEQQSGRHEAALETLSRLLDRNPRHERALRLSARICADLGEYAASEEFCRRAMELDPLDAAVYQLLASIADERGDRRAAKELLKRVIYLAPGAVTAYLELAALYTSEGHSSQARRLRRAARELLRNLPDEHPIEPWRDVTAGELRPQLEAAGDDRE